MSFISKLLAGGASTLVESVGKAVDSIHTSKEEKMSLQNKKLEIQSEIEATFTKLTNDALQAQAAHEKEITARWEIDMQKGGWLPRNIRPASLVFLLAVITICAFTDGNVTIMGERFAINPAYVDLFGSLLNIAFLAYFGSRGAEKIASSMSKRWSGRTDK